MNIVKSKKGFTLVELIIVIVIIGILSTVSVPVYRKYITQAAMTEGYTLVGAMARAELIYSTTKGGGKFLTNFGTQEWRWNNYSYERTRELGIRTDAGQYKYFCNVCVGNSWFDNSRNAQAVGICACGYSDGLGPDGGWDWIEVATTVYSDGHIDDLQECYDDNY